jgi:TIR domain
MTSLHNAVLSVLGEKVYHSRRFLIGITQADRLGHRWVLGKTGAGKSTLLTSWFHENLENLLIGKLGERPVVWRDPRTDQTDLIGGLLDSRINTSALMLVIVSPSYFKSKWCGWEREKFVENATKRGGLRVANKSRSIKVVKTHDERTVLPEELQETLGGEFLRHEQAAGKYVELDPQSNEGRQKLEALVDSIKSLVEAFRDHTATAVPLTKEKTVYLAETDAELDPERNDIKREFEQNGYHILPSVDLPLRATAADIEEKVRHYLESAQVSVHMARGRWAAHTCRWAQGLHSKGSWGACTPKVFPHAAMPLARRTERTLEGDGC